MTSDLTDKKIPAVLAECCSWDIPATLLLSDEEVPLTGWFDTMLPTCVRLAVFAPSADDDPDRPSIRPTQLCVVTFLHDSRPHFFTVPVVDANPSPDDDGMTLLDLRTPRKIPAAERRQAVRVPLGSTGLVVGLTIENRTLRALLRNVSLFGALLEFDADEDPRLSKGDRMAMTVPYESGHIDIDTVVCQRSVDMVRPDPTAPWIKKARYGVEFSELRVGQPGAFQDLKCLVAQLRQQWLKSRGAPRK